MILPKKLKNHALLPVFIVLFVLSSELIVFTILEFMVSTIKNMNSEILPYSDEFLDLVVLTLAKGIGILVIFLLLTQKLRLEEIEASRDIKLQTYLGVILIYVGCTTFLMQNLNNPLLIISDKATIIKVWPEIILSRVSIDYIGYQIVLVSLLFAILPIFEELLYRKVIIQVLSKKQIRIGWILVLSSLMYAISPFISNLVIYSEEQAIWDFVIRIFSGLILAIVFHKTQNVKYPIILRSLVNCVIYIQFLTMFHPFFLPLKELYSLFLLIFVSIGIFLFFYLFFDGITTFWSTSSIPPWLDSLLDFRFSEDVLKPLLFSLIILLPVIPFGLVIFVDRTILFGDLGGSLLKTIIKSFSLGAVVLICGIQIITNKELYKACSEANTSLLKTMQDYYSNLRENYQDLIKKNLRGIFRNFGIIILIIGALCPIFFFSMAATIFTRVPGLGTLIEVNMEMRSGQNPFYSYSRVDISSRSPWFWMIPTQRTTQEMFYLLKHTNNGWYFLPDTFMSHPGDWIHGLLTVSTWFFILFLMYFVVHEYRRNRKIIASCVVICLIGTELLWYLLTMGIGSIPSGEGPPPPSANQTLSQIFQMDFEMNEFLILPLGLIIFLSVAIIFLYSGVRHRLREKKDFSYETSEKDESEEVRSSHDFSSTHENFKSEELGKNGDDL
ncbi:MAG: CPBP family intramembrane metalloprotease [Candidatus Heimdallarchaeota archaeon]|nr:MAG: CPBP family intramembrane metalloprotease [Candidatus Heimdallarchaeota archaeon]